MNTVSSPRGKAYKSLPMEGVIATWYAKNTAGQRADFEADARKVAGRLASGARILELAPGPGYLALALAELGDFKITGLDVSRAFVRIASDNAARAGAQIDFQVGDAAAIPFPNETFDAIVCRAAFKNFTRPEAALSEMHRVLRPGGRALIIDMSRDASDRDIDDAVKGMRLRGLDAFATQAIFKHSLRKRAYSAADFQRMAGASPFGGAQIEADSIGLDVWLSK